jgi:hypothetical protein
MSNGFPVTFEDRDVVHPLPDLRPLDVRVAGVRVDGDPGRRNGPHRVLPTFQLERVVRLHVAADIGREAVILGEVEVLVRDLPHGRLQRVDLGKDDREIERPQELDQASHHEDVRRLLACIGGAREAGEPLLEEALAVLLSAPDQVLGRLHHLLTSLRCFRLAVAPTSTLASLEEDVLFSFHSNRMFSTKVSSWIFRWS